MNMSKKTDNKVNMQENEKATKVVSFIDKQREVTQQRYAQLEESLAEMMAAIEDNARLQLNLHDLTLEVMRCADLTTAIDCLVTGLQNRFGLHDVQLWGQPSSFLAKPVPTEGVQQFMQHMQTHAVEFAAADRFPCELWAKSAVVSAAAFRLSAAGQAYAVLLLGRADREFDDAVDVLFLQQFVDIMSLWLAQLMHHH